MANASAIKDKNIDVADLDFDELISNLDEDIDKALDEQLIQQMSDLEFIDEQRNKIGNLDDFGQVVLDTVWEQFTHQIAVRAGEDFVKENQGLGLNLSKDAHIINPDNFEKGKLPTHNFDNIEKYQKRYDETRADFQTDPNMKVKMNNNMRYDEQTNTYERYDKKSGEWVGKTRYNKETKVWEDFNSRNGKWQKKLAPDARKKFDTRTKNEMGNKTINKDHVVSAAEQLRDNEAATYMDREQRQDFAKSKVNIQDLDSAANQSKGDLSTEEWLNIVRDDGKTQAEYHNIDEAELKENDKRAREAYKKEKEEAKKVAISEGKKSQKDEALRVGKKAARAIIMNLLADLVKNIIRKFVMWLKSANKNLKTLLVAIKDSIVEFVKNLKNRVVSVLDTAFTVIINSILGPTIGIIKKAWLYIKLGWKSLKEAIDYIRDPENRNQPFSMMLMQVGKIVIGGLTAGASIILGEVIEKGLTTIPIFAIEIPMFGSLANIIGIFMGALVAGIIGALAINLIDRLIAKKQKQLLDLERIDKANAVLVTQQKIQIRNCETFNSNKNNVLLSLSNRHIDAKNVIEEALETIVNNDIESNEEAFKNIDKKIDELLGEE